MTWVKVDDDFYDHPKFLDRTASEIGLWLLGLAYCNRYLTDGFISVRALRRTYPEPEAETLAAQLVHAGLWEVTEGGWLVHDYHDRQPSAEEVRRRQKEQIEKSRKGAEARWGRPNVSSANACRDAHGDANRHAPRDAKRDAPSRPVPNVVRDADIGTSRLSGGPGGTDDDHHRIELAKAACNLIGKRRHDEASAKGTVTAPTRSGRRSHLRTCQRNAWAEQGDLAVEVATEHPDWTTVQVADEVLRRDLEGIADVVQMPRAPWPRCRRCEQAHDPHGPHGVPDEYLLPEPEEAM